jgi:hypothetical protein
MSDLNGLEGTARIGGLLTKPPGVPLTTRFSNPVFASSSETASTAESATYTFMPLKVIPASEIPLIP